MAQKQAMLIIGGGAMQCHAIQTARSLGLLPLVTDRDARAPGIALAERWYPCDTMDARAHKALVPVIQRDYTLRGVMTAGSDTAPSVAAAAWRAGTPGIPLSVARRTHDKARVYTQLMHRGMGKCVPASQQCSLAQWRRFPHSTAEAEWIIAQHCHGYPVVIKPLSQSASRGVSIVHEPKDLLAAIARASAYGDFLLQQYLAGSEHSAEMLLDTQEKVIWFNIVDRVFRYDDGIPLEIGHINPSCLDIWQWESIRTMMKQAARMLGVRWGPWKADVIWTADGPKILEVTARLSGGFDSQGTSLALGYDPTRALMQLACRMPVDAPLQGRTGYAACAAAFPAPGRILNDPDDTTIEDHDGVLISPRTYLERQQHSYAVHVLRHSGDSLEEYTHCATRPGFVISTGKTYEGAWENARNGAEVLAQGWKTEPTP